MLNGLLNVVLVVSSVFLICLVLIQRGKGGGLAGAFGGAGGSSAFGTKAGDIFTKVTIYTAIVWIFLNMILVFRMNQGTTSAYKDPEGRTTRKTAAATGSDTGTTTGGGATTPSPAVPPPVPKPVDSSKSEF